METTFLSSSLSLLVLLTISTFVYILSKKINFPYTVLLVIVGLFLVPISQLELFNFINHFELTPDILFFVFLPILLFEAAYKINYREFIKNWKSIWILAVFWLIFSAALIWIWLFYLFPFVWFEIPFLVCLLFWILISATDPVAVLSIFKEVWAPKRLTLLFEWESLFNDWTALALFLVVLWVILEWWVVHSGAYLEWIWSFLSMLIWWIIFWWFIWILFAKVLWYIKNNESAEITLTMILAHVTFLLAEFISHHVNIFWFNLEISWVIATTVAWIILWNYWKFKITPAVEQHMEKFWDFFAFISNSIVFILMWLVLSHIEIDFIKFIWPIWIVIFVVILARAMSIYLPIWLMNLFKFEEKIPMNWQHLLSWWSLRWALALMMALMIPWEGTREYWKILEFQRNVWWNFDFDIKDFILVITIWSIMFTLLVKATTITWLTKKLWIDKLDDVEKFEYEEWKILANLKILGKINNLFWKKYLTKEEYFDLKRKYWAKLKEAVFELQRLLQNCSKRNADDLIKKAISIHALWIEKQYLKSLYKYNEISEKDFKFIYNKICKQKDRVETWETQVKTYEERIVWNCSFWKFLDKFTDRKIVWDVWKYVRNRTKTVITRKVIKELKVLRDLNFWFDKKNFDDIINLYEEFYKIAEQKKDKIFEKNKSEIVKIESKLVEKSLLKLEEKVINDLHDREIITQKLYIKFIEEIEKEFYRVV